MATRRCRVCGCTDKKACKGGCSWVEVDLCSACLQAPPRVRATGLMWAHDYHIALLQALRRGITVTRYALDPMADKPGETIEFEIRVTRVGKTRLPRITKGKPA